jgi:S1-C subfamily serine protease
LLHSRRYQRTLKRHQKTVLVAGFFVAPKYVLTSYHILEKCAADKIFIKYPTYRAEQAVVSAYDKTNDLALLKT